MNSSPRTPGNIRWRYRWSLDWEGMQSFARFPSCSLQGLQVTAEHRNLPPLLYVGWSQALHLVSQECWWNSNSALLFEDLMRYSILLKHFAMQSSMLHRKAALQRVEYPQKTMTQKAVPHVLLLLNYTILCVHLQTTPVDHTELRQQLYQQWNFRTDELREAKFCFVVISCEIISWDLAPCLFDREGYRTYRAHLHVQIPGRQPQGLPRRRWKAENTPEANTFPEVMEKKINTQTHKWYCSGLRSEILFAKLQLGVICSTEDFQKPQADEVLQRKCWCDSIWSAHPLSFIRCSFTTGTRLRNLKRFKGLPQLRQLS